MSARLTDVDRSERKVKEADLQSQITDLAEIHGWSWVHWRPLLNRRGFYEVPFRGPLGKGWPDLTMVRVRDRRMIFAELKRQTEHPSADQVAVLAFLAQLSAPAIEPLGLPACRVEAYLWRPSDLRDPIEDSVIGRALR